MSAVADAEAVPGQGRVFLAVLSRDIYVTWGEFPVFLAQVILQPFFLLFVFGKVLGSLGYTTNGYSDLLFPGLLALTAVITSMQTLAFPLVIEFGWTKEIEDRLLAPMSTWLVALEKVVFATLPGADRDGGHDPDRDSRAGIDPLALGGLPLFLTIVLLGSLLGASLGLVLGTLVKPNRINIVFSLVFTPLLFTGCSQYPWPSLKQAPLVPGDHGDEPDDVRQRGPAGRARAECPAYRTVDLPTRPPRPRSSSSSASARVASSAARSTEPIPWLIWPRRGAYPKNARHMQTGTHPSGATQPPIRTWRSYVTFRRQIDRPRLDAHELLSHPVTGTQPRYKTPWAIRPTARDRVRR